MRKRETPIKKENFYEKIRKEKNMRSVVSFEVK